MLLQGPCIADSHHGRKQLRRAIESRPDRSPRWTEPDFPRIWKRQFALEEGIVSQGRVPKQQSVEEGCYGAARLMLTAPKPLQQVIVAAQRRSGSKSSRPPSS